MFTGIIEEVGTVREIGPGSLVINARTTLDDTILGDSIAVNGCDLTVTKMDETGFYFGVMEETYNRTNLGELSVGARVNLERACTLATRLGGHLVRGVVEYTGSVISYTTQELSVVARFAAPPEILRYTLVKGPITINGVSLTVIAVDNESLSVGLIPYTQEQTNLLDLSPGAKVNLESDIIARYVDQLLTARSNDDPPVK